MVYFVEVYYRYCIDVFKSALDTNYNFNVIFRFSQAQDEMNNSKKFGDYLNKLDINKKTIRVDINHEHTLVKEGYHLFPNSAPNGKISYTNNSSKKYKVSLFKYDEVQKSDIIIDYSNANIENLKGSNILSLPAGLKVDGYLDLSNTWIASLPEGLEVGSDLSLDYTMIEVLPKGLKVYGDLHIRRTRLKKYKYDELIEMIKPGFIFGNILS